MFPQLDAIVDFVNRLVSALIANIQTVIVNIRDSLLLVWGTLRDVFTAMANQFKVILDSFVAAATAAVNSMVNVFRDAFQSLVDRLQTVINSVVASVGDFVNRVGAFVVNLIQQGIDFLKRLYDTAVSAIGNTVTALVTPIVRFVSELVDTAEASVRAGVEEIRDFAIGVSREITESFNTILSGASSILATLETRLADLRSAFAEAAQEITTSLAEHAGKPLEDIKAALLASLKGFAGLADPETIATVAAAMDKTFSPNTLALRNRADAHKWVMQFLPKGEIGRIMFMVLTSAGMALSVYSGIAQANAQVLLQEFAAQYNYQLLSPADCALAVFRQDMPREEAIQAIIRQGYTVVDANRLIDNASSIPGVGELLSMQLRGIIPPEEFRKAMVRHGLSQAYENAYLALAQIIPPVGDLIHMAVKGSFSPEEVATFRTLEDFPETILPFAEKQGLSREWMERYWSAHWNLPSPGQGFEMFQRGIINPQELGVLLKALDITPFWRDKMVNLAYNVLTRVDVRRMHQLGILNDEDVVKAHMDMGYSPTDSERLLRFTIELNKGKPGETSDELGRLSRTNVVGFYQDGVIDAGRAISLLTDIGYSPEAAKLFIETADFDAERVKRAADIEFIIASAVAGVLDFGAAQDQLNELHLSPTEIDRAVAKLLREQTKQTKLPTVEQGTKMFAGKAITEEQFRDLLKRLGYRAEWVNAFVAMAKKPEGKVS